MQADRADGPLVAKLWAEIELEADLPPAGAPAPRPMAGSTPPSPAPAGREGSAVLEGEFQEIRLNEDRSSPTPRSKDGKEAPASRGPRFGPTGVALSPAQMASLSSGTFTELPLDGGPGTHSSHSAPVIVNKPLMYQHPGKNNFALAFRVLVCLHSLDMFVQNLTCRRWRSSSCGTGCRRSASRPSGRTIGSAPASSPFGCAILWRPR